MVREAALIAETAQWEFGQPTLTPTNLEDKTEVKVDKLRQTYRYINHGTFLWILD